MGEEGSSGVHCESEKVEVGSGGGGGGKAMQHKSRHVTLAF